MKARKIMEYKYSLIVSQCYHQHHQFLVEIPPDFIEKGKKMVKELAVYKGEEKISYLGDIESYSDLRRYNFNGFSGDIYIINSSSIAPLLFGYKKHLEEEIKNRKYYKSKKVINHLMKYHDYYQIKEIIEKYFKII